MVEEQIDVAGHTANKIGWQRIDAKTLEGGLLFCSGDHAPLIDYEQKNTPPAVPTDVVSVSSGTESCGTGIVLATVEEYDFLAYVLDDEPSAITGRISDEINSVTLSHTGSSYKCKFTFATGTPTTLTASANLSGGTFGPITVT